MTQANSAGPGFCLRCGASRAIAWQGYCGACGVRLLQPSEIPADSFPPADRTDPAALEAPASPLAQPAQPFAPAPPYPMPAYPAQAYPWLESPGMRPAAHGHRELLPIGIGLVLVLLLVGN